MSRLRQDDRDCCADVGKQDSDQQTNKPLEIAVVPIVHTGQSVVDAVDAIVHTGQTVVDAAETLIDLRLNGFQRSNAALDGWHLHNFFLWN